MPAMTSRRAFGIARAVAAPARHGISGSSSPCTTSVGVRTKRSASERSPWKRGRTPAARNRRRSVAGGANSSERLMRTIHSVMR